MRIGAVLELKWDDADLEKGKAFSRAEDNKSKKDKIHQIQTAVPLLKRLHKTRVPGEERVFPWNYDRTTLANQFEKLQQNAGIHLSCPGKHEHTSKCHVYGFHGFRYAHATYNYGRVSNAELQEQMGHASFQTTLRYVKYAEAHQGKEYDVFLPKSLRSTGS